MARSLPQHVPEVLTRPESVCGSIVASSKASGHTGGVMNRIQPPGHHHLLTGSLSAPSSPSQIARSSIPLKMRQGVARQSAIPPNIIVEKGRIEFVKNGDPATSPLANDKHKLVMGTKIFRPPSSSKKLILTSPESADEMPPKPKSKECGSISFRDRSASPKFNSTRESTPPLPDSKIPSGVTRMKVTTPDVIGTNSRNVIPRPGFINKSRETSPSPQPKLPLPAAACKSGASSTVPVSPNLIRWRAKLSGSSGVTNHLNVVAGSHHPKKTTTTPVGNTAKCNVAKSLSSASKQQVKIFPPKIG